MVMFEGDSLDQPIVSTCTMLGRHYRQYGARGSGHFNLFWFFGKFEKFTTWDGFTTHYSDPPASHPLTSQMGMQNTRSSECALTTRRVDIFYVPGFPRIFFTVNIQKYSV